MTIANDPLVTLNSEEEETLLQDRYGESTAYWIGINDADVEGQWEWVSGEAVTYTNWAPGQPDDFGDGQDYGHLNYRDGQWDDNPGIKGAVVENGVYVAAPTAGIIELAASYDDTLFGGGGDDALYGGAGNDYLYGESLASSLDEGLVAHWHFDEGSGLTLESTTGKHHGTVISENGSLGWADGLFNSAIDFGDNISHVRVADSDELDITRQITIATWVNGDEFQTWDGLVTKGIDSSAYSLQVLADGRLRFQANQWTGGVQNAWKSEGRLTEGNWHHAAVTYDGEAIRFYIDGQLDSNISYADFQFDVTDQDLVIGADLPGHNEFFDGQMDDTRLYNRALSDTEILKLAESSANTFEYNGSTYLLTSDTMTWTEAQAEAESLGGNLVTVNDEQEREWLNRTFDWDDRLWIGLSDAAQEGTWQWASGEDTDYTHWTPGQPDNNSDQDYAVMNWEDGKWADAWNDGEYRWNGTSWDWEGNYRGIIEIKQSEESQNDVIVAGVGNDTAIGGVGDDIINGSDAVAAGYFERDQLWGGAGADTFVLGDYNQAYYQGEENQDYALIKDLDSSDTLQLYGSAGDYTVEQQGSDTSLYYNGDLVAVFEKTTDASVVLAQANFV
ncbi:MAG: LamG-like jellyroll fold domain-containing protein [Phormidesmis sp.]